MPEILHVPAGRRQQVHSKRLFSLSAPALILSIGILTLTGCAAGTNPRQRPITAPVTSAEIAQQWGVQIVAIRSSAAGYMLDFRYRVTAAEKAAPLLKQETKAYVIVEKNGAQLYVPIVSRIGPLRQSSTQVYADRNYFVLFANPGKLVLPGDAVTVVIGDFKVEHLIVDQS